MADIIIPYKPREIFKSYHKNTKRLSVTVAHRRAGKTVARVNRLIREAVQCQLPNPRFAYLAPYYVQAKDIAWQYLKQYTATFAEFGVKANEADLSITLPFNGAVIKLYGAENAERMRGVYQDGIVIDEAQGVSKHVLTAIILPSLADRKGWLDVSGTPKGWDNLLGELVKMAKSDPQNWYLEILKASETGVIDADELKRLRTLMPENEYRQEFEVDFDAAITGSVYGEWIAKAEELGRIVNELYDPSLPVHTAWDLGFGDATSIWFWQYTRGELRLIDYYENNGKDIAHYCEYLAAKSYKYDKHYVPHDAANKLLAAGGRSTVQIAYELGVKMFVVAATSQSNQIECTRMILNNAWFDTKCEDGIACLKQYQFEFDKNKGRYRDTPRHDWASHGADSLEIIGQVLKKEVQEKPAPKPRFLEEMTANELFWGENTSNYSRERI